ncbi:hypothetical protein [Roseovarius salinarum]|uniref:hypothetical protein n=1 Tax=Roseovarius salinarum TaxID=1981892 RepID=UPI000C32FEF5|nr:hypothetical protein [Roseovarius salinarum]
MKRFFIIPLVAGAFAAATLVPGPARADADDFAKAVVGVTALAIIGSAIADRHTDRYYVTRHGRYYPRRDCFRRHGAVYCRVDEYRHHHDHHGRHGSRTHIYIGR